MNRTSFRFLVEVDPEKLSYVESLSRRTAHAVFALLESSIQLNMPVTAQEVMVYDGEALTAQSTGSALREAAKLGLAGYTGRYWIPSTRAYDLRRAFEDRYLRETEELCP